MTARKMFKISTVHKTKIVKQVIVTKPKMISFFKIFLSVNCVTL